MRRRVALLVPSSSSRRAELREFARRYGQVLELISPQALVDLARDGALNAVVISSICDLGLTAAAVLRVLAVLADAKVTLVVPDEGVSAETCEPLMRVAAVLINRQRSVHLERARAGRERARKRGVHVGRPARMIDVERARELLAGDQGMRAVARALGVSPRCLRRHLQSGDVPDIAS